MSSIAAGLQQSAGMFPDKVALVTDDNTLTFRELDLLSNRLANALASSGFGQGDVITLYSKNCWEWVVSYYAVAKLGAIVNPINALLTPEEVRFIVRDCESIAILGTREKLEALLDVKGSSSVREVLCFDGKGNYAEAFSTAIRNQPDTFDSPAVVPESHASICYTSGTTGHPKGAVQTGRNVLLNAQLTSLMHGRTGADTVVTALPGPHVYGTVVMNAAILNGMKLVLHSVFDESHILKSIQQHRATLFEGVPTMYLYLLEFPDLDRYDLSSLRICTVGGQTMPVVKMQEVERRFGCPLIELWGMTELAGLGTTFAHTGPVKHGSIGVPLPYCRAKIVALDDASRSLPAGEAGELMVRGPVVMSGYHGNAAATSETITEEGWLHTGDVACMDEDGFIFIVDRKKDMILTAGYNVYPAEIERVVSGHPDVAMVAVAAVPDKAKGELAKAYIVPKAGAKPQAEAIIAYCRQYLAAYKLPRAIQFVDDLPKTSTGKILRRKLKELDRSAPPAASCVRRYPD